MLITGMSLWSYYATWFLRYFIIYLLVHVANSFIISFCFPHVPYYIPITVYLLFDIVLIIQSFFIQIFITRAKIGIIFALLFFILQYAISYAISSNSNVTE
jgi:ATP-binding cassette subfamily A (ABC1) protein 3